MSALKKCLKCGMTKPRSEFNKDKQKKDGLRPSCRSCRRIENQRDYKRHKETRLRKNKEWRQRNPERAATIGIRWKKENPERWAAILARANRRREEKHPLKKRARRKANYAVKIGKLVRPDGCESCGEKAKTTMHHYLGYEEDHWLDVIFLCGDCHRD
jgi:hypothetical protein